MSPRKVKGPFDRGICFKNALSELQVGGACPLNILPMWSGRAPTGLDMDGCESEGKELVLWPATRRVWLG